MQRRGSLILSTWPCAPHPPGLRCCTNRKTFKRLCHCPSILAHCISWHVRHHGMKQVHGSRPMSLALCWRCFSAVVLLTIYRAEPCHRSAWQIFRPSCMTAHVTRLLSFACPWERAAASREPFVSIPNRANKPFCGWPWNRLCAKDYHVVIPIIIVCGTSQHFQNVIWSFTLALLWGRYSSGVISYGTS